MNLSAHIHEENELMSEMPSLKALLAFEAVGRLGRVSVAADELNVSQSAVSHQLANLEKLIGRPLFERAGRSLSLSDAGQDYLQKISVLIDALAKVTEDASRFTRREQLTVSAPPTFLHNWLLPNMSTFLESEPNLDLRLVDKVNIGGDEAHNRRCD